MNFAVTSERRLPVRAVRTFSLAVLIFCALVCGIAAQEAIRKPGEPLRAFVGKVLPAGAEEAHPPATLAFGPSSRNVVVLFRPKNTTSNFRGLVLVPDDARAGTYRRYELPPMQEIEGRFDITVKSVFTADADRDADRELVVLYEYYRTGSGTDSGYAAYVYDWNGNGFVTLGDVSDKLTNLKTAAVVRRKLKQMTAGK